MGGAVRTLITRNTG